MMMMLDEQDLKHLPNEEYLIEKAKIERNKDPLAAKSWLLTAQVMYPKDFKIQYEAYRIAKDGKNIDEAAKCLKSLFLGFPDEPTLSIEMDCIMRALCDQMSRLPNHQFYIKLFYSMPKDVQKAMILTVAEKTSEPMTYCSLMLLLTSKFPENTAENGLKLVEALSKAEKPGQNPLNPYRDKLVTELLPRLLQAKGLDVKPEILYQLLSKAIQFYVAYVKTSPKLAQNLLECDTIIEDPWQELFNIVRLIGWNLGWELASDFENVSNRELILQKIQSTIDAGEWKTDGEDVREILYTTFVIFLHSLLDYIKRTHPDFTSTEPNPIGQPILTLIEGFISPESTIPFASTSKKHRLSIDEDHSKPLITVSLPNNKETFPSSLSTCGPLSQALITAIKSWELLHTHEKIRSEFVRELEGLSIEQWVMLFNMDYLIYSGRLVDAEAQLKHTLARAVQAPPNPHTPITILTLNLKLASVLFALNKYSLSTEVAFEIVKQLGTLTTGQGGLSSNLMCSSSRRHLHLLALTRAQVLQFITTLLIHQLRHLILKEERIDDLTVGHIIVLMQYEWNRYASLFDEIIVVIKKRGGLTYHFFGSYVTTIPILEKFSYLASTAQGGFYLDLIPAAHSPKQQRISTRGADRDSKQDFKAAMKRQMLRVYESIEQNIIAFLTMQVHFIAPVFM